MNLYFFSYSSLINAVTSFVLGLFVLFKNFKSPTNRAFTYFAFSVAWWATFYFLWLSTSYAESALAFIRSAMVGAILIPATHVYLTTRLLNLQRRLLNLANFTLAGIFICFAFSPVYIQKVEPRLFFPFWPAPSYLFHFMLLYFLANIVYAHLSLWQGIQQLHGVEKIRVKYVFYGTLIGFVGGCTNYFLWYKIPVPPYLNFLVSVYVGCAGWAIIRYQLMDITLLWRQVLIFASYFVAACLISTAVTIAAADYPVLLGITMALLLLTAPFTYRYLQRLSAPFVDKVILKDKYSYWEGLGDFWEKAGAAYTSDQLAWTVVPATAELMSLSGCSLIVFDRDKMSFVPKAQVGLDDVFGTPEFLNLSPKKLDPYDPLIRYLIENRQILERDKLAAKQTEKTQDVLSSMDAIRAHIIVPLFVARRLTALLSLSPKQTGDIFHQEDIHTLAKFSRMTENHLTHAVFLENSIFYSGNIAHDIRSPFKAGIIYDYMDDIRVGLQSPSKKKAAREAVNELEKRIRMIHKMSEAMVDIYKSLEKFVGGKFNPEEINYQQLVTTITAPYARQAQQNGITLEVLLPETTPLIYAEALDAERILSELLTNAFKYTKHGKIKLEVLQENKKEVLTRITDTGCGIPQDKLKAIFEPFRRIKQGADAEGVGIGLASIRHLVDANGGRIWVKSKPGEGSEFSFVLPSTEGLKEEA